MPYPNEHSCSLRSIPKGAVVKRTNRTMKGKTVSVIWAKIGGKMQMASVRFKRSTWSAGQAASVCKSLGGTFHPAKEG